MKKEAFYFSHDYMALSDPKLQALTGEHGAVGYGIYWYLIELLHQEETHWLPLKEYVYLAIAKQMKASAEQVEAIVKYCVLVCDLFVIQDEKFTSRRVLRNFEERDRISEIRSNSGKMGAIAKQNAASAQQNLAKPSKEKKRKEKENKEKKTNEFIPPTLEDVKNYFKEKGYTEVSAIKFFEYYSAGNWHDSENKPIVAWKQKAIIVWFKDENKINNNQPQNTSRYRELP